MFTDVFMTITIMLYIYICWNGFGILVSLLDFLFERNKYINKVKTLNAISQLVQLIILIALVQVRVNYHTKVCLCDYERAVYKTLQYKMDMKVANSTISYDEFK